VKWLADIVMRRRARTLFARLAPHLPDRGTIADVGSGTGHNAEHIRQHSALAVCEYDVADLHWVGTGPTLISDDAIPTHDRRFASLLLLFVLQYVDSVPLLLGETRRVADGPVIVLQSTYSGAWGLCVLRLREFFWGRAAHALAALFRLVCRSDSPLVPRRFYTRAELVEEFRQAGFAVRTVLPANWPGLSVSRDLFVLEALQP
jgi:hypothetical protein